MTHPITPPPELVQQWRTAMTDAVFEGWKNPEREKHLCVVAAQWGADQELEACLTEVSFLGSKSLTDKIRAARRPKPPSLKEQALLALDAAVADDRLSADVVNVVRRALKQLDD
jgi:hypothetical protein